MNICKANDPVMNLNARYDLKRAPDLIHCRKQAFGHGHQNELSAVKEILALKKEELKLVDKQLIPLYSRIDFVLMPDEIGSTIGFCDPRHHRCQGDVQKQSSINPNVVGRYCNELCLQSDETFAKLLVLEQDIERVIARQNQLQRDISALEIYARAPQETGGYRHKYTKRGKEKVIKGAYRYKKDSLFRKFAREKMEEARRKEEEWRSEAVPNLLECNMSPRKRNNKLLAKMTKE